MDYEEYMRSILGYNQIPNNIYTNSYDDYYYDNQYISMRNNTTTDLIESMYPEIYRIIYPMVCKICTRNNQKEITRDLIDSMTEEIYSSIEGEEKQNIINTSSKPVLKNGDVRNPNVKENEMMLGEVRQRNFLMHDLIKILILRELLKRRSTYQSMPPLRPSHSQMPHYRPF